MRQVKAFIFGLTFALIQLALVILIVALTRGTADIVDRVSFLTGFVALFHIGANEWKSRHA